MEACRFHNRARRLQVALKATGLVISLKTKLLIVGDSVMVVFQAPGDGGAGSYIGYRALCSSNNPKQQCGRNTLIRAGTFADPFLPATRRALPSAICKDRGIDG
jgi:hypothetical protein